MEENITVAKRMQNWIKETEMKPRKPTPKSFKSE